MYAADTNMATSNGDSMISLGEVIDKSLFEDSLVDIAGQLRRRGKSVYDLETALDEMSAEKDKYVLINIYKSHASIIVVDKELFHTLLFEPVWGQMIDGPKIALSQDSAVIRRMATSIPLQQYHICLDETNNYVLARNMYYFDWLMKSRSFYVGESAMAYLYLQVLCLTIVPSRYRLIASDCLEFAKAFAREVATRENDVRDTEVRALFTTLRVSEQYMSAALEQSSRNSPSSAMSVAVSYFMSFKPERMLVPIVALLVAVLLYHLVTTALQRRCLHQ